jgi:hypothetical protein
MAMLAKVQIIFPLIAFMIIFFIKNFEKGNFKSIFQTHPTKLNILINIIFISLIIYYIDHYFFKRIDKIFFLFFLITNFIILAYFKKKKISSFYPLIVFFLGCLTTIFFIKFLNFIGIISYHPSITKLISSPIFLLAEITSGYQFGLNDNLNFIFKLIDIFQKQAKIDTFLLNKLCLVTYFASLIGIFWYFIKKNYNKIILIILLNIIFTTIYLIFSIRPYSFYLIYTIPFNLITFVIILDKVKLKKTLSFVILITYLYLDNSNIKSSLSQYRKNHNLHLVCAKENIIDKYSYMRFWHKKYDENFLYDLCAKVIVK